MSGHLLFVAYLLLVSAIFALLEIQIEGKAGWASGLPTWRIETPFTRRLLGARAITGYHVYIHAFVLALVHAPFALGLLRFSWNAELRTVAFLILFWIMEDFLWFVFNPEYGIRSFKRERVWWHAQSWWGFMPRDYWIFTPVGVGLYLLSYGI